MELRRKQFQKKLEEVSGYPVYFRPPTGFRIPSYPCIIYDIDSSNIKYADNSAYSPFLRYKVNLLTRDPDDEVFEKLIFVGNSRFLSSRQTAGINEFSFTIYY